MMKLVKYMFWNLLYKFRPSPKNGEELIKMLMRTRNPFSKFEPHLYRNEEGKMWQIYFKDEIDYVETRTIKVEAHISRETGHVVGFNVWDEELK